MRIPMINDMQMLLQTSMWVKPIFVLDAIMVMISNSCVTYLK